MTLVVEGSTDSATAAPAGLLDRLLRELLQGGVAPSQAAKIAAHVLGVARNEAYDAAVRLGAIAEKPPSS